MIEDVLETGGNTAYSPMAQVSDYLSASANKDPLLYPGERPDSSYITDGSHIYSLQAKVTGDELSFILQSGNDNLVANNFLADHGAPPMEERIPVLAFGANLSPGSLRSKFDKIGRPDAYVVPTIYTTLLAHDVVWSGAPGMNGNPTAVLYKGQETVGTEVDVGVNFLTREQLLVMHATEMNYTLSSVEVEIGGRQLKVYYYSGQDSIHLRNHRPVAITSIPAKGRLIDATDASGALADMLQAPSVQSLLRRETDQPIADSRTYVEYVESLRAKVGARTELKKAVNAALAQAGMAPIIDNKDRQKDQENWANPSVLPTLGEQLQGIDHHHTMRLASQELGEWADVAARQKVIRSLASHYHRHQ